MISYLGLILISTIFPQKMDTTLLKQKISAILEKQQGVFAVAFRDISSGEQLLIHEQELFHAASTMKTPVLIEAYKQAAAGRFSLQDSIMLKNEFKSIVDGSPFSLHEEDDSEKELYRQTGQRIPISALLYAMIIRSSNLATNTIIELVGAGNVQSTIQELGVRQMKVLRGVEDQKAFDKGLNNVTTAYDLLLLFQKMAEGRLVSEQASQAMIDILLDQQFNEIIPARLPKNVRVAHKTGEISGVRHDSGIVLLPDGRKYVLVLLSKKITDEKAAVNAMAEVSEMIYKQVTAARN
jgi:beta-lactamase class A